jgi:hypothetical protein
MVLATTIVTEAVPMAFAVTSCTGGAAGIPGAGGAAGHQGLAGPGGHPGTAHPGKPGTAHPSKPGTAHPSKRICRLSFKSFFSL